MVGGSDVALGGGLGLRFGLVLTLGLNAGLTVGLKLGAGLNTGEPCRDGTAGVGRSKFGRGEAAGSESPERPAPGRMSPTACRGRRGSLGCPGSLHVRRAPRRP